MSEQSEGRRFLAQFPPEHQGAIGNWFYEAARSYPAGTPPQRICSHVFRDLQARHREGATHKVDLAGVLRAMQAEPQLARAFAAHVIEQEQRPAAERTAQKEQNARQGREAWMERQPPTLKQKNFLQAEEPHLPAPENRLEASRRIQKIIDGRKRRAW